MLLLIPAFASAELTLEVTHYLTVTTNVTCPDNTLHVLAMGSDGNPGVNIALRLALMEPYQGLRAVMHTDENGMASVELTKTGLYRLRIYTDDYNHEEYLEFNYSEMCPPPPPKQMEVDVEPDCINGNVLINITSGGVPVSGVLIRTEKWSSLTGSSGFASFPLEEGLTYISAESSGYAKVEFYKNLSCAPPPECVQDGDCADDQYCANNECVNVTGTCGYAANHSWMAYDCCSDSDCGADSLCTGNRCVLLPPPPEANLTNESEIPAQPEEPRPNPQPGGDLTIYVIGLVALLLILFFVIQKVAGKR